ncbi:MAG: phosphoribosylanthranilate isomerase [Bacteroidia bacterium]|nr:phosphoribosylanthranilate isomerase [Bacteroidia bacterium]
MITERKFKLKVCGMCHAENISKVADLEPDYLGFIFYPKSKRFVGDDFEISGQLSRSIKRVGVFVNEKTEVILGLASKHGLDFIQLHGDESVTQCIELKQNRLGIIKAFSIDDQFNFDMVNAYKPVVDYFLFDTKSESYGGTGKAFNWRLLNQYDQQVPFFLSGGLSASNMKQTKDIMKMNLHGLDINSGVEVSPGVKDVDKIKELNTILDQIEIPKL